MDELISKQAAIDAIIAEGRNVDSRYLESERIIHESDAVEAIAMLPSVQPKNGEWINDRGLYKCSRCKQYWAVWWAVSMPIERMLKEMPYCPKCGSYNGE